MLAEFISTRVSGVSKLVEKFFLSKVFGLDNWSEEVADKWFEESQLRQNKAIEASKIRALMRMQACI
jgi:hypothetical protein